MIVIFLTGCTKWEDPSLTPRVKAEQARTNQEVMNKLTAKKQFNPPKEPQTTKEDAPVELDTKEVKTQEPKPIKTTGSVPKPDCDGRLIPTYNFRNEVTGYRCVTDSNNYECPGHRAGDTWTKEGKNCECLDNGSIECTE